MSPSTTTAAVSDGASTADVVDSRAATPSPFDVTKCPRRRTFRVAWAVVPREYRTDSSGTRPAAAANPVHRCTVWWPRAAETTGHGGRISMVKVEASTDAEYPARSRLYRDGRVALEDFPVAEISDHLDANDGVIW